MKKNIYDIVKPIMDKYGIPYTIWAPIMDNESEGDPNSKLITPKEYSVGLFQINKLVHPQYANLNLFDPAINAEIAARDFIAPGYATAKKISSDEKTQALITYSGLKDPNKTSNFSSSDFIQGGIKPAWTTALKEKFLKSYTDAVLYLPGRMESVAKSGAGTGVTVENPDPNPTVGEKPPEFDLFGGWKTAFVNQWVEIGVIFAILMIMVVIGFMALKGQGMDIIKQVAKG